MFATFAIFATFDGFLPYAKPERHGNRDLLSSLVLEVHAPIAPAPVCILHGRLDDPKRPV
jgi:hypothetical protein